MDILRRSKKSAKASTSTLWPPCTSTSPNLEKKGLLTRDYNRSRSIDLLPPKGRLKQSMSVNTGSRVAVAWAHCRRPAD